MISGRDSRELHTLSARLKELGGQNAAVQTVIRKAANTAEASERPHLARDVQASRTEKVSDPHILGIHYAASFRQTKSFISKLRIMRENLDGESADVPGPTPSRGAQAIEGPSANVRSGAVAKPPEAQSPVTSAGASDVLDPSLQSLDRFQRAYGRVIDSDGDVFEDLSRLGENLHDLEGERSDYLSSKSAERTEAAPARPSAVDSPLAAGLIREFAEG